MRDSDWSRANLLRSDWLPILGATMTTSISNLELTFLTPRCHAQQRRVLGGGGEGSEIQANQKHIVTSRVDHKNSECREQVLN